VQPADTIVKLDVHGLLHTTPPKSLVGLAAISKRWLADRREGCLKVECNDRSLFYCLGKLQSIEVFQALM
jgi:hypothetical protein